MQALVRPIAEHHALRELTREGSVALHRGDAPIASADEFRRLLEASPLQPARIVGARAAAPAVWWEILEHHPDLAVWVAANRHIDEDVIAFLAAHPRLQVRVAVASNPCMSDEVMTRLAHDKSDLVRMRVACNARATRGVLAHLVADACVVVSKHAEARLQYDLNGIRLPASYLDEVSMSDLLH
ncbi:MAG TPA: hypothetical protein VJ743_16455 [Albitalea sp.]|nr:hypothetical protein [Albitalea sp.]